MEEGRYRIQQTCPWCKQRVLMDAAHWIGIHNEPEADWSGKPPECVGSCLRMDDVRDLAEAREAAGGRAFQLRPHP